MIEAYRPNQAESARHSMRRVAIAGFVVFIFLLLAILACSGTYDTMVVNGLPQYTCPSATPKATDTPLPTSPPRYPPAFNVNLDYPIAGPTRYTVTVQWAGQSVGNIRITTIHYYSTGGVTGLNYQWVGSITGQGPIYGAWTIYTDPAELYTIVYVYTDYAGFNQLTVSRGASDFGPFSYPCYGSYCVPSPIYPTPRPTYTPYPTPTLYVKQNDYFVGDWVYDQYGTRIGYKMLSIQSISADTPAADGSPRNIYVWRLQIWNRNTKEYSVWPAMQTYVSSIRWGANTQQGFWAASEAAGLEAAKKLGIPNPNYDMVAIQPGQQQEFYMAAYGPVADVDRVTFAINFTQRPTPGSSDRPPLTQMPGDNGVTWINQVNTVCRGDITPP